MSTIPLLCPPQALQHLQRPGGPDSSRRPPGCRGGVCHHQDSRPVGGFSGYGTSGPALHLRPVQPSSTRYMCTRMIWLAESAIQGTVG